MVQRQGCLSLFLFDLVIEPLAITLRMEERISGVTGLNKIHKISLYADDLLLFLSNQQVLIDILLYISVVKYQAINLIFPKVLFFLLISWQQQQISVPFL